MAEILKTTHEVKTVYTVDINALSDEVYNLNETVTQLEIAKNKLNENIKTLDGKFDTLSQKLITLNNEDLFQDQALQKNLKILEAKVESWSGLTEPLLTYHESRVEDAKSDLQSIIAHESFVLGVLAIAIAIIAILITVMTFYFQKHVARSQKEAVSEAINTIEGTIANGILPKRSNIRKKLLSEIFGSDEFIEAFRNLIDFEENSDEAEEEQMTGIVKDTTVNKETLYATQKRIELENSEQKSNNRNKGKGTK